jgi:hypothetical protein
MSRGASRSRAKIARSRSAPVLGLARAVARATPDKRVALTTWASRRMAGNVSAGNITRDLAHRVLFEAAMRNGLPAMEAGSIIEKALKDATRG